MSLPERTDTDNRMREKTSGAIAAELAWAASGAAREIEALRERVAALQQACDERTVVIAEVGAAGEELRTVADERGAALASLDAAFAEVTARLEAVTAERDAERARLAIARRELEADLRAARREIVTWRERCEQRTSATELRAVADELQRTCDERLALIERLTAELDAVRAVAAERDELLTANDASFRERETELVAEAERRTTLLSDLTAAYEAQMRELEALRGEVPRAF